MVIPLLILGIGLIAGGIFIQGVGRSIKEKDPWYPGKDLVQDTTEPIKALSGAAPFIGIATVAIISYLLLRRR
jgi:hypothetical protein